MRVKNIVQWAVVITMPFFLGFTTIRLFVDQAERYVAYEYAKKSFPVDLSNTNPARQQQLGIGPFSRQEREALALVAVDYLQRPEAAEEVIYLLEEQRLPGTDRPLYNDSEISHMVDVKRVTDAIGRLNVVGGLIVLGGLLWLIARPETRRSGYRALFQGGIATVATLLGLGLFILLFWNTFFVLFHELLFPPDTWQFAYTDSLIRLFPEKFWFDFGVLLSGTALGLGVLVALAGFVLMRRADGRGANVG